MRKLSETEIETLKVVAAHQFWGGSFTVTYGEYRRRESLRKRGLLKFEGRRKAKFYDTFHNVTDFGLARLRASTLPRAEQGAGK